MITLPIISIVCCFAYVFYIVFKYGVPVSISETYYLLPNKWDILFAVWTVLTSVPFGIYWFQTAPDGLKWIPIVTMIALLMIGVADCYKSGPKKLDGYEPGIIQGDLPRLKNKYAFSSEERSWWQKLIEYLKNKFNPKTFFKYGPARLIHYVNSLVAIILSTVYLCCVYGSQAVTNTVLTYVIWIVIGMRVDGVYNPDYSLDVNNKAWIFFMEIVCLTNLYIYLF